MDLTTFLTVSGVVVGIIATLLAGAVWVMTLTTRLSNRALNAERDVLELRERVARLEHQTAFSSLKETFSEVVIQVLHSKEFQETNKRIIRDTLLHIAANKTAEQAGALSLILEKINDLSHGKEV